MKKIQTLWMLASLVLITSAAIARDLKLGMRGDDVKQWQVFLQRRNFDLPADGYFGPVTKRATLIFQKKWKLYADGVVGAQTLRKAKTLGYGSAAVASGELRPSSGGQSVSKATENLVIQKSVTFLLANEHDYKSFKLIERTPVRRLKNPGLIVYLFALKYASRDENGRFTIKNKVFSCDGGGNVLKMEDMEKYGYNG